MEKSPSHSPLLSSPPSKMGSTAQVGLTLTVLTYTVLHSVGKTENTSGFARTLRVGGAKWLVLSSKLHWDMTPLILEPKQWKVHELPSKVSPLTAATWEPYAESRCCYKMQAVGSPESPRGRELCGRTAEPAADLLLQGTNVYLVSHWDTRIYLFPQHSLAYANTAGIL